MSPLWCVMKKIKKLNLSRPWHVTADGVFDNNPTYKTLTKQFPSFGIGKQRYKRILGNKLHAHELF